MIRSRLPLAALMCLLLAVPAATATAKTKKPTPPSRSVVVKLLKAHYLGDDPRDYPAATYTFTVHSVSRGASRVGGHWADGTPLHRKTIVFPIHATSTRTVTYNGSRTVTDFDAKYVFFKDEFGDWTFTIKSQKSRISH